MWSKRGRVRQRMDRKWLFVDGLCCVPVSDCRSGARIDRMGIHWLLMWSDLDIRCISLVNLLTRSDACAAREGRRRSSKQFTFIHHDFYLTCARTRSFEEQMEPKEFFLEHTKPLFNQHNLLSLKTFMNITFYGDFQNSKTQNPYLYL